VPAQFSEGFSGAWRAEPGSVTAARGEVVRYLNEAGTPDPPLNDVALALSEAVSNVVNHAYVDAEPGEFRVQVRWTAGEIELIVEDDGRGLLPRVHSPGVGLGLPLIARLSDRFDTRTDPGRGTRLCIWFKRDPGAATVPT
jgi:anti-sigma regulatory factor (Ser/Thr protein kinase)